MELLQIKGRINDIVDDLSPEKLSLALELLEDLQSNPQFAANYKEIKEENPMLTVEFLKDALKAVVEVSEFKAKHGLK